MSISESREILTKLPLPRVECNDCGLSCVYQRYDNTSVEESWLTCTGCGKRWDWNGHRWLVKSSTSDL